MNTDHGEGRTRSTPAGEPPARLAAWLVLLVALTTLPSIASRELMPTDEPRFALVARQMVEDPAPVVPHLGYDALTREGERYADKPPVFFWLVSLFSFATGGVDEVSARLPSLLAAVAIVLLTWRMGRLLFDGATGALGAALLATTNQFFLRAAWCSIDMTLTAFTTAAALCWLTAARTPREGTPETGAGAVKGPRPAAGGSSRVLGLASLGGLFAAAATLSKGPVGLIFPVTLLAADRIAARLTPGGRSKPPVAAAPSADGGSRAWAKPVLAAATAFVVPVGLWIAAIGAIAGSPYVVEILFKQNVTRYVAAWNNIAPWYYYFGRLPVGLLPWLLLLPGAALLARGAASARTAGARGLLLACAALFIFFSASTGKRGVYLLPLYPALALLLAEGWRRAAGPDDAGAATGGAASRAHRRLATVHVVAFLVVGLLATVALPVVARRRAPELAAGALVLGAIVAVSAIAAAALYVKGRRDAALVAHIAGIAALVGIGSFFLVPVANRTAGVRDFGARLAALSRPDDYLVVDQEGFEQILFYSRLRGARRDFDQTKIASENGAVVMEMRGVRKREADDPGPGDGGEPRDATAPRRRATFAGELERAHQSVVYPAGARVLFVVAAPRADRLRRQLGPSSRMVLGANLYGKPYEVIASR